ncbi:MAG TPA: acyl-CoA dehydrogenase family protein [Candidatus Dormibacteraeota bacterium]|jgi:acyl-CoA dehydrogenase|nr:acyl-CoA dehydrogenase family protein [Candidatus Dormibacteraeota bacterium]
MPQRYYIFDDDHEAYRESMRSFVLKELRPNADEWERAEEFPIEMYRRMGQLDLFGNKFEEEYGGTNAGYLFEAVLVEEMSRCGSGGVAAGLGAHAQIALPPIASFGTPEQKQRWLAPGIKGEKIAALGITEPEAGSDVAGIKTRAVRDGDDYVLNGSKTFITNGVRADMVVCAVRTGEDPHGGVSFIVVERGTPGFDQSTKLKKLGWRASDTATLYFSDCRVPAANMLGNEGDGFKMIMSNFQWERLTMALGAVIGAEETMKLARDHAENRVAFDRPIVRFQTIQHKLVEMATEIEAARHLTYHALWLFNQGRDAVKEVSMAKIVATEAATHVADEAVQIHGGYGYMMEFPVQRAWRDARLGPIGGGTTQIMREIIAKTMDL